MSDLTPAENFRPGLEKSNTLDAHQQVGVHFLLTVPLGKR